MKHRVYRVLLAILVGAFIHSAGAAQEDEGQTDAPQASDQGTPGLVQTVANLNLCPQALAGAPASGCEGAAASPPIVPPQGPPQPPKNVIERSCKKPPIAKYVMYQCGFDYDDPFVVGHSYALSKTQANIGWDAKLESSPPVRGADALPVVQRTDLIFTDTNSESGHTLNVYKDYSFEVADTSGTVFIAGYLGIVGEDTLVAYGENEAKTRYAFTYHDAYFSAVTQDGDFYLGNGFTAYRLDLDEDGQLLSLTDSDGGEYDVQLEEDGSAWISGSDGYEVYADAAGAFELYDAAGDLVVEGNLFDDTDDFAAFDAMADDTAADADEALDAAIDDPSAPGDDDEVAADEAAADEADSDAVPDDADVDHGEGS